MHTLDNAATRHLSGCLPVARMGGGLNKYQV